MEEERDVHMEVERQLGNCRADKLRKAVKTCEGALGWRCPAHEERAVVAALELPARCAQTCDAP